MAIEGGLQGVAANLLELHSRVFSYFTLTLFIVTIISIIVWM